MTSKMFLTLPSGQKMPILGLGTAQAKTDAEIETAINTALELGYRHIDTAWAYENERPIGNVLKQWLTSGKLKREDLFITTKLPLVAVHPDRVDAFMKKSLENLQLDYVDLYLIHLPVGCKYKEGNVGPYFDDKGEVVTEGKTDHAALWKKMEEQVEAGHTKNIGLSNYNIAQISTVLKTAKIKPANLQIEMHMYLQQKELVDFCHENGITVVAYCPIAHPGLAQTLERMGIKYSHQLPTLFDDPVVTKIAEKHKKTSAQVALRFLVQIGVSAIPKSVTPKRIEENINVFDFGLDEDDMKSLYALERGEEGRLLHFKIFMPGLGKHPDYPFK